MRWLVILAKAAFICNITFLICLVISVTQNFIPTEMLRALIIILGFVLSVIVNIIVNSTEIVLAAQRQPSPVMLWLRAFNFVVFALQIAYFFIFGNAGNL